MEKEQEQDLESSLELETLYQCKKELQALLEHPGWARLTQVVNAQVMLRRQESFARRIRDLGACFETAERSGEVAGMQAVLALPQVIITDATASIGNILAERRQDKDR